MRLSHVDGAKASVHHPKCLPAMQAKTGWTEGEIGRVFSETPQTRNASRSGNVVEGQPPIQPGRWNLCLFWLHPSARPHVHFPAEDGWKVGSAFDAFDGSQRMMSHSADAEDDTPRGAVSRHACVARTGWYPWPICISQHPSSISPDLTAPRLQPWRSEPELCRGGCARKWISITQQVCGTLHVGHALYSVCCCHWWLDFLLLRASFVPMRIDEHICDEISPSHCGLSHMPGEIASILPPDEHDIFASGALLPGSFSSLLCLRWPLLGVSGRTVVP